MAYANYFASVEWGEVTNLRSGLRVTVAPHSITAVSHLLARGIKDLGGCLEAILDKGEVLSPVLWHPLRVPMVHAPSAACSLATNLRAALEGLADDAKGRYAADYEIAEILRVLDDAAKTSRGVLSVLEPPADGERAQRVICPFDSPEKLVPPWGNLARTLGRFSK